MDQALSADTNQECPLFIVRDGRQDGPFTQADLELGLTDGTIQPEDLVTAEGWPNAVPLASLITDLGPLAERTTAPAPRPAGTRKPSLGTKVDVRRRTPDTPPGPPPPHYKRKRRVGHRRSAGILLKIVGVIVFFAFSWIIGLGLFVAGWWLHWQSRWACAACGSSLTSEDLVCSKCGATYQR